MSKASKPAKQSGTELADSIRASSLPTTASTGRTQDCTRPGRQNIKSSLATREPSTQDLGLGPRSGHSTSRGVRNGLGVVEVTGPAPVAGLSARRRVEQNKSARQDSNFLGKSRVRQPPIPTIVPTRSADLGSGARHVHENVRNTIRRTEAQDGTVTGSG
jgi:hypothetical protein